VLTAFPWFESLRASPKAEQQVMLPGIRFVCAAVVLAVSLVIFGMGAAALLRSAHEEFASLPNRRPPPATVFSRQPETAPTLAMLRLEPRGAEIAEPAATPRAEVSEPAPVQQAEAEVKPAAEAIATAAAAPAAEPEKPAVVETPPVTPSEPAIVVAAAPIETIEAAPQAVPAPETTGSISLPTAVIMELPTATLTEEDAKLSSSKVAVLGGPPIDTEPVPLPNSRPTAEPAKAKPAKKVVKKPVVKKRRVAARVAPAAAPVAQQQQDPFGLSQLR
jgi:hypothetical protein